MAIKLPPLEGANHFISLAKEREMTALFKSEKENILDPAFKGRDILSVCETFNREAFDTLLAQEGCEGIRIYSGMTPDLKIRIIAVGVNSNNEDILPTEADNQRYIVEEGIPCPPWCPPPPPPPSL